MKNKETKKSFCQKILSSILCTAIAVGCMLVFPQLEMKAEAAGHVCEYKWVTISEGSGYADLYEEYKCDICGAVSGINYKRSELFVRDELYKQIEGARKNGVVTVDFGLYHTVHDDLFTLLTKRNDVTVIINYQYQSIYHQTTFQAGADYSALLQDDVLFYGMPGFNGQYGITTAVGNVISGSLSEEAGLEGAELLYSRIKLVPNGGTVYFDLGDVHTVNDALFTALTKRSDATVIITYQYKDVYYKTTFQAGADYSELLTDSSQFYGMLGLSGRCGITTAICE